MEKLENQGNDSLNTTYTKSPEGSPKSNFNGNQKSSTKTKNPAGFIKKVDCINDSSSFSDRDQDVSIYVPATQQVVHFGSTTLDMIPESDVESEYDIDDSNAHNNSTDLDPEEEDHKSNHNSTFTLDPEAIDHNSTFNIEPPTAEEISKFIADPECKPSPTVKKVKIKLYDTFGKSVVINDTIDDYESDETQIIIPATQAYNWKDHCIDSGEESKILESETEINSTFDLNETYNLPTPKKDLNGTNIVQNNMTTLESCSISIIIPVDSQPSRSPQVKEKSEPSPQKSNKDAFKFNESINSDPVGFIITRENEVISPINAAVSPVQKDGVELMKISPAGKKKIPDVIVPSFKFPIHKADDIDDDSTDEDVENVKTNSRNKFIFSTRSRKYKEELEILKDIKNPRPSTSLALRRENSRIQKLAQMEEKRKKRQESAPFVLSRPPLTRNRNIVDQPVVQEIKNFNRASKRTDKDHVIQAQHKRAKMPHFLGTTSSDSENDENDKVKGKRKVIRKHVPAKNSRIDKKVHKIIENGNDDVDIEKDIPAVAQAETETKDDTDTKQEIEQIKVNDNVKNTLNLEKEEESGQINVNTVRRGNKRGAPSESHNNVQSINMKKIYDNNNNKNGQKDQDNIKSDADDSVPVVTISSTKPQAKKSKKATTITTTTSGSNKNSKKATDSTEISNNVKPKTVTIEQLEEEKPPVPKVSPRRLRNRNHLKSEKNVKPAEVIVVETKPKVKSSKAKLKLKPIPKVIQVEKKASPKKVPPKTKTTNKNSTKVLDVDPAPAEPIINEGLRRSGRNRKPINIDDYGTNFMKFGVGKVK